MQLTIALRRHVVVASWLLLLLRTKRGGIGMALRAGSVGPNADQAAVGAILAASLSAKSGQFSGVESINAAQLLYGVSKRIVWNQCVAAPASTTKIAITKFCGRVLIGNGKCFEPSFVGANGSAVSAKGFSLTART